MIERECDAWMEIARQLIDAPLMGRDRIYGICAYRSMLHWSGYAISDTTDCTMRIRLQLYLKNKAWGWSAKVPAREARAIGAIWLACEAAAEQGDTL